MGLRVCLESGCGALVGAGKRGGRCPAHGRERERQRGSASARGYGPAHRRLRTRFQRLMDSGEAYYCWRCGRPIDPNHWHLGHNDLDRTRYQGPECPPCNLATSGRH